MPHISTGDIFRRNVAAGHRRWASRPSATWTPASTCPTASRTPWCATGSRRTTAGRASCSTATRARWSRSASCPRCCAAGRPLDQVIELTVDIDEVVARLVQARRRAGPQRRHRGRHPPSPRGLLRADRAAHRHVRGPGPARARRRHGLDRRGHRAHRWRPSASSRERCSAARARSRSSPPTSWPSCGRPDSWWRDALAAITEAAAPGVTTGELDAHRRGRPRRPRGHVLVPRLQGPRHDPVPRRHLRIGQRRGRARDPRRPGAARRRPAVGRLRRHRRRLAWRRRRHASRSVRSTAERGRCQRVTRGLPVGGPGRGPSRRAADRHRRMRWRPTIVDGRPATTASSRSTAATASARACTWTRTS